MTEAKHVNRSRRGSFTQFALLILPLLILCWGSVRAGTIDWDRVRDESVDHLSRYLRISTYNPPADTRKAVEFLRSILEKEGIQVKVFDAGEGRQNLLARIPGNGSGRKPLLLLHHIDVVPADPELWSHPPLGGVTAGQYLWGRGAIDMKGMGIMELMAFLLAKRQNLRMDRDLLYLAVAEEETGGERGARWMVENHWEELDPEYVWDEGLVGTEKLFTERGVVWGISVAEKKVFWLRLIAEGTAGHGSQPHDDNPVDVIARALARLSAHRFPAARNAVVEEIFQRLEEPIANKFTNAIQRNTCSLTTMTAGVGDPPKVNVIPSRAEATIDCRILPDVDPDEFLDQLKEIMGKELFDAGRIRIETIQEAEKSGTTTRFDSDLFLAMQQVVEESLPGSVAVPVLVPWGTDSRYFRERGVKAYGFIPIIVGPGELARMHGVDERISIENVGLGTRLIYQIIERFAGVR